jgi:hypothetical protein
MNSSIESREDAAQEWVIFKQIWTVKPGFQVRREVLFSPKKAASIPSRDTREIERFSRVVMGRRDLQRFNRLIALKMSAVNPETPRCARQNR